MPKTKIEWCTDSVNPIKGRCPMGCNYCYAEKMRKRFKTATALFFDESVFLPYYRAKKPRTAFVCSTMDLFHPEIPSGWVCKVLKNIQLMPQHRWIFLTKNPHMMREFELPESNNIWYGVSVERECYMTRVEQLTRLSPGKNHFISFEPLTGPIMSFGLWAHRIAWVIIGGMTPKPVHEKVWVSKLADQCTEKEIPFFIKDNAKHAPAGVRVVKELPWEKYK